jgi:hypothetical protein
MRVTQEQGKYLLVAQTNMDNNAIASIVTLLCHSELNVTPEEKEDHGCGLNNGKDRNYVYIPTPEQLLDKV